MSRIGFNNIEESLNIEPNPALLKAAEKYNEAIKDGRIRSRGNTKELVRWFRRVTNKRTRAGKGVNSRGA